MESSCKLMGRPIWAKRETSMIEILSFWNPNVGVQRDEIDGVLEFIVLSNDLHLETEELEKTYNAILRFRIVVEDNIIQAMSLPFGKPLIVSGMSDINA